MKILSVSKGDKVFMVAKYDERSLVAVYGPYLTRKGAKWEIPSEAEETRPGVFQVEEDRFAPTYEIQTRTVGA